MTFPIFGRLELAAKHSAHDLACAIHSPTGRYFGIRRGLALLLLDRSEPDRVHAKFEQVFSRSALVAVHPRGDRIALRDNSTLEVRTSRERVAIASPDTVQLAWNGERLAEGAPRPAWGYADEHLTFTADGRQLVLATHGPDAQACLQLYDAETLALLDSVTDLRCYSPYAVDWRSEAKYAPMTVWSESWMQVGPYHPETALVIRNAGDSALAVFGIEVADGKLRLVDQADHGGAVFGVDAYFLRGLHRLPKGDLLMMDRDSGFSVIPWPPGTGKGTRLRYVTEPLRNDDYRIVLPFPSSVADDLDLPGELSIGDEHLFVNIDSGGRQTAAILVVAQPEIEAIGLIPRPRSRAHFHDIQHLGEERFASASASQVQIWKLVRE